MALTDIIEQELLASLNGEGDPQAVLDRHSGSKGPLYAALARATAQGSSRLVEVRAALRSARTEPRDGQARRREAEEQARRSSGRRGRGWPRPSPPSGRSRRPAGSCGRR